MEDLGRFSATLCARLIIDLASVWGNCLAWVVDVDEAGRGEAQKDVSDSLDFAHHDQETPTLVRGSFIRDRFAGTSFLFPLFFLSPWREWEEGEENPRFTFSQSVSR